jgi:hypothetical protein
MRIREIISEMASAGATSAANVGVGPVVLGKNKGDKKYTGSPGKSGTHATPVKTISKKNKDGTVVNALDMTGKTGNLFGTAIGEGGNLFSGGTIKRG